MCNRQASVARLDRRDFRLPVEEAMVELTLTLQVVPLLHTWQKWLLHPSVVLADHPIRHCWHMGQSIRPGGIAAELGG